MGILLEGKLQDAPIVEPKCSFKPKEWTEIGQLACFHPKVHCVPQGLKFIVVKIFQALLRSMAGGVSSVECALQRKNKG